jgi:hypothetical protein
MDKQDAPLQISDADVICFSESQPLSLSKTIKIVELKEQLLEKIGYYDVDKLLISEGVKCELLQPGSQGWQKGKIRIQIEFIPDEIRDSSDLDEFRDDVWPPIDPIT